MGIEVINPYKTIDWHRACEILPRKAGIDGLRNVDRMPQRDTDLNGFLSQSPGYAISLGYQGLTPPRNQQNPGRYLTLLGTIGEGRVFDHPTQNAGPRIVLDSRIRGLHGIGASSLTWRCGQKSLTFDGG